MPAAPAEIPAALPGAGASRKPGGPPGTEDFAGQPIWLCGGGELPAPLLAALTGQAPWAPPGSGGDTGTAGFAQGGVLDGLAPGAELAMFLQDAVTGSDCAAEPDSTRPDSTRPDSTGPVSTPADCGGPGDCGGQSSPAADDDNRESNVLADGLGALDDAALTGVVRGWRRLSSWVAAMEHAAVAELARRRIAEAEAAGCWAEEAGRFAGAEVAAALTLTRTAADTLVGRALAFQDRPATAAALAAGRIDLPRALVISDGLGCLEPGLAAAVEASVLAAAPGQTTGQLRAAVAAAVIAADPAAAETRRRETEKQARVEHRPEPGGVTAMLAGRDLPAAETAAAANRITALAAALQRDGATGGLDLLRAQVFVGLLLGRPIAAAGPDTAGGPRQHAQPAHAAAQEPHGATDDSHGGDIGPAAGTLAAPPLVPAGARWAAGVPTAPPAGSINLAVPLTAWLALADGPGELAGYGPVTAETARHLLPGATGDPATRWCLTITGDHGQAVAHGCARPRRIGERTLNSAPPGAARRSELTLTIQPLAGADCAHRRASASYQPPRSLRHLIEIRDQTCAFPGCRRPAVRCDKDHTVAYDRGGKTCECNLSPSMQIPSPGETGTRLAAHPARPRHLHLDHPIGLAIHQRPHLLR